MAIGIGLLLRNVSWLKFYACIILNLTFRSVGLLGSRWSRSKLSFKVFIANRLIVAHALIPDPHIRLSHPIRIGKTNVYATKERS